MYGWYAGALTFYSTVLSGVRIFMNNVTDSWRVRPGSQDMGRMEEGAIGGLGKLA